MAKRILISKIRQEKKEATMVALAFSFTCFYDCQQYLRYCIFSSCHCCSILKTYTHWMPDPLIRKLRQGHRERERAERGFNSRVRDDWTNGMETTVKMTTSVGNQVRAFLNAIFVELRNRPSQLGGWEIERGGEDKVYMKNIWKNHPC